LQNFEHHGNPTDQSAVTCGEIHPTAKESARRHACTVRQFSELTHQQTAFHTFRVVKPLQKLQKHRDVVDFHRVLNPEAAVGFINKGNISRVTPANLACDFANG